jgi:hypothetical protein
MSLAIAFLALQAAAPAPPAPHTGGMVSNSSPPPIVTVVTSPAPPVLQGTGDRPVVYAIPEANDAPPDVLELRVSAGSEILWDGRIRVGRPGASMIQHLSQTEPVGCPKSPYANSVHSSISIALQRTKLSVTPEGAFNYPLRVSWERPSSARGCSAEGARKVEISKGVDLKPGQSVTLKGDVGLEVRVRRQ